jgi:hypothetical protein
MDRVGMRERLGPQAPTPFYRKLLSQLLTRKPEPVGARLPIDHLQVTSFVKEHVVQHESANGERGPFPTWDSTKLLGHLPHAKRSRQAYARGKSTQGNFAPAAIDIAVQASPPTLVVEMNRAKPSPQFTRQPAKDYAHVLLADMMDPVRARGRHSELDALKHVHGFDLRESSVTCLTTRHLTAEGSRLYKIAPSHLRLARGTSSFLRRNIRPRFMKKTAGVAAVASGIMKSI